MNVEPVNCEQFHSTNDRRDLIIHPGSIKGGGIKSAGGFPRQSFVFLMGFCKMDWSLAESCGFSRNLNGFNARTKSIFVCLSFTFSTIWFCLTKKL